MAEDVVQLEPEEGWLFRFLKHRQGVMVKWGDIANQIPAIFALRDRDGRKLRAVKESLIRKGIPIVSGEQGIMYPANINDIEQGCKYLEAKSMDMLQKCKLLREAGDKLFSGQQEFNIKLTARRVK